MEARDITPHTVELSRLRTHYLIAGDGPPVVLFHGVPQHSHQWRKVMPALAARYTVVAPDFRGFGGTEVTPGGYDSVSLARDVRELLDHLGLEEDLALVGHGLGGGVAYAYASLFGGVRAVVQMEYVPPGFGLEMGMTAILNAENRQFPFFRQPHVAGAFLPGRERAFLAWYFNHYAYDPNAISMHDYEVYVRELIKPGAMRAVAERVAALRKDQEAMAEFAKRKLDTPVLVLGGARATAGMTLPAWERLAEDASGTVVERAGHWLTDEQPEAVAGLLAEFLDLVPTR